MVQNLQGYGKLVTNAVHFDIAKTEAVLFSKKRNHQGNKVKMSIQVDENNLISFNPKPTR
jgi:hypothetical protein